MQLQERFTYGKYKGLQLIEVYRGTLNIDRQLLKAYVNYLLNGEVWHHFAKNFGSSAFNCVDEFHVTEQEIRTLGLIHEDKNGVEINEFVTFIYDVERDIEYCLTIGNQIVGYEIGGFCSLAEFSRNYDVRLVVGADPGYLSWCIENIKEFYIPTTEIEQLEKLRVSVFNGIHVFRKEDGLYEYFPDMDVKHYRFPDKIRQINQSKIEQKESESKGSFDSKHDSGPSAYGYDSWDEMSFYEAYEGDSDAWAHDNQ